MASPKVGKKFKFKFAVGIPGSPAFIPAGTIGIVDEIVAAPIDGAGDHDDDCAVLVLPNGRRWSHSLGPRPGGKMAMSREEGVDAANPPFGGHDLSGHTWDDLLEAK